MLSKITAFIILIAIGWVLFFFGGWHISLSKKAEDVAKIYYENAASKSDPNLDDLEYIVDMQDRPSAVLNTYSVLIKFGKSYVGLIRDTRFFDVAFVNWLMLVVSLLVFYMGFYALFNSDDQDEEGLVEKEATQSLTKHSN